MYPYPLGLTQEMIIGLNSNYATSLVQKTLFKSVKKGFLSQARGRPNSSRSKKFLPFKLDMATDLRRHCLSRLKSLFKSGTHPT